MLLPQKQTMQNRPKMMNCPWIMHVLETEFYTLKGQLNASQYAVLIVCLEAFVHAHYFRGGGRREGRVSLGQEGQRYKACQVL